MMFARFRRALAREKELKELKEKALADAHAEGYAEGYAAAKTENGEKNNESPKSPKKAFKIVL